MIFVSCHYYTNRQQKHRLEKRELAWRILLPRWRPWISDWTISKWSQTYLFFWVYRYSRDRKKILPKGVCKHILLESPHGRGYTLWRKKFQTIEFFMWGTTSEEEHISRIFVLGLAHTRLSAGRVARTSFSQVFFSVRYWVPNVRGSGTSGAPRLCDCPLVGLFDQKNPKTAGLVSASTSLDRTMVNAAWLFFC